MKIRNILSLGFNISAFIASLFGFIIIRASVHAIDFVKYFTLVTNCLIMFSSLISIGYSVDRLVKKDKDSALPCPIFVLKLITAVGSMITLITVACYLQHTVYKGMETSNPLFWNNIFHHYLATSIFTAGFIFFDIDRKYSFKLSFFGILALIIYMAYAIPFSNISACSSWWGEAPYVFVDYSVVKLWVIALVPGFIVAGIALSIALWLLNRIVYLIFIGEEISEEEIEEDEKQVDSTHMNITQEDQEEVNKVIKSGYSGPRIYHVSKRQDKKWQVKFANGQKAIKLFDTQAEAIVFAKQLAKSQEGSIRVHSLKGRIRKAH